MSLHAWWRALLLILIGVFLKSLDASRTVWSFHDTLSQIGMGYGFLFLLGFRPVRDQWIALAIILVGYFAAFGLFPLPPADFDYERVAVTANWLKENGQSGFAAHWQKNSNLAWAFDTWYINLFPRDKAFVGEGDGYATLSFVPMDELSDHTVCGATITVSHAAHPCLPWVLEPLLEFLQPRFPIGPTRGPGLADEVGASGGPGCFERLQFAVRARAFAPFQVALGEVQPVLGILGGQLHGALQMLARSARLPTLPMAGASR